MYLVGIPFNTVAPTLSLAYYRTNQCTRYVIMNEII